MSRLVVGVGVLVVLVGCSGGEPGSGDGVVVSEVPVVSSVPVSVSSVPVVEFEVADVDVPRDVSDGVLGLGGAVLDGDEWGRRFPAESVVVLPRVNAEVVEAASEFRDGVRFEERTWMVVDTRDRYELIEELRGEVGAVNVVSADNSADELSKCAVTVAMGEGEVSWTVRACDYPSVEGMHALGVVWSAPASGPDVVVDVTVGLVLDVAPGVVTSTGARLQVPGAGEEALVRDARIEFSSRVDPVEVGARLRARGLSDWALQTGEGSVILTGPRGESWVITDRVAQFDAGGAW